jgi:hypothetical protein
MPVFATMVTVPTHVSVDGPNPLPVSGSLTTTPSGTQNVAVTSPATFPVSGTVTTVPSGTQTVTGTVTATPTGTQAVSGTVTAVPGVPVGANFYTQSFSNLPGQTAATYNYLSLFNPVGSGKTITLYQIFIIPWAGAATTALNSMESFRISASSAGALTSGANINKFSSAAPNSIAEVRITNPTVTTTGTTLGGIPPIITSAGSGLSSIGNIGPPPGASFMFAPGEGVCMRQVLAGDVDQLWNLGYIWAEA